MYAAKSIPRFPSPSRQAVSAGLRRGFWALMLLFHLGPVVAVFQSVTSGTTTEVPILRLFVLSVSAVFFVLKLADVPCLRLKPGWRSVVAAALVMVLLHVNVAQRAMRGDAVMPPAPWAAVLVLGGVLDPQVVRRAIRRLANWWAALLRESGGALLYCLVRRGWESEPHPLLSVCFVSRAGPRAPPHC